MIKTLLISGCMALLLACSDEQQPMESDAVLPLPVNEANKNWQFEVIRDQIVTQQCEKLKDPNAFQPSELVWD